MNSLRKIVPAAQFLPLQGFEGSTAEGGGGSTYYFEDGWVFREHHGKFVECLGRFENKGAPVQTWADVARVDGARRNGTAGL